MPAFAAGNLDLNYHRVGARPPTSDNVGIVNFNAVRDDKDAAKLQVFVRVLNFRRQEVADARVKLESATSKDRPTSSSTTRQTRPPGAAGRESARATPRRATPTRDSPGEASSRST